MICLKSANHTHNHFWLSSQFDNELFDGHDEYVYEPDLDPDMVEDGHRRETEMNESGLSSSGMHEEDEDIEGSEEVGEEEEQEERENLGLEELKETNEDVQDGGEDDDILIDDSVDMSVSASAAGGKRRARSISGVTRQGVPIVDEPYVPRRNRTRHPHRIFEQLRQRPEELVTPPTSGEMFRWDVENRKTHTASHSQQSYGSISIRPYQHEMHQLREHHSTTTPMPVSYGSHSGIRHHSRNEEIVMAPESRVRLRQRKAGAVQGGAEPVAKGLHLVKQSPNGVSHRNVRHRDWTAKDNVSKQALLSQTTFAFDGEQLTINEPGLYYLYAQVTYDNEHGNNGYKVMVGGKKHLSCTVHVQGQNTNACFTAGLTEIETAGTTVVIEDFDHGRHHVMYPEKTFFGVYKVGRLPPHTGPNGRLRQARKVLP
uniref:THD domain-containing protein n=1 Tax=Anopheles coluzzii TaxID=1518534 RepID=A0A8W7PH13_ANOCL